MKKIFTYICILIFAVQLGACTSTQKLINQGRNEEALIRLKRQLANNKHKEKNVALLESAFTKANAKDLQTIERYKAEGRPDSWDNIHGVYKRIDARQKMIEPLLPLYIKSQNRKLDLPFVKIDEDLIKSKQNAAEYYYVHAQQLLKSGTKNDARTALDELNRIAQYYPNYKDTETLKRQAKDAGTTYILYSFRNDYRGMTPAIFQQEFMKMDAGALSTFWHTIHTLKQSQIRYDDEIVYKLKDILVTPEQYSERQYEDTKEIQDGYTNKLDAKGNIVKDSLGNAIKVPKYKIIKALVKEVHQFKKATLVGEILYYNNASGQILKSEPLGAESIFENYAATFIGDKNALSEESKRKIGNHPQPFPSNESMILQANETMKPLIQKNIQQNQGLFY